MATDIPASITTPDTVETRLGTLRFFDGLPDEATVQAVYDNLDFQRGVQAFLTALPAPQAHATRTGDTRDGPLVVKVPAGYTGDVPECYFVVRSRTYGNDASNATARAITFSTRDREAYYLSE